MIRIWDCYWNLVGSLPVPDVWPADCFGLDEGWRWRGARHVTLDCGGRRWSGVVQVCDGKVFARYVEA